MNFKEQLQSIPFNEFRIWLEIRNAGFDTYLVGGAVRDIVLGKRPNDWDFATNASPSQIKDVFSGMKEFSIKLVGEAFGVTLVNGIEVATFRGDRYFGGGDKDVEITYVDTIEEDLERRDFTFNAMALDIFGNLIDPFDGVGALGIESGRMPIVRFVGNAVDRINEDPNRILRAFRFTTTLDGRLAGTSYDAITNNLHLVGLIAPERIRLEVLKVLSTAKDHPSFFWNLMLSSGVLKIIFPEFVKSAGHDHGEYHSEDVWTHALTVGDSVSKEYPLIRLAALLHDVGKPRSYDPVERSFYQHHTHSADIIREWMTAMKFTGDEIRYVVNLALVHMDGTRGMSMKARRKLKNKLGRYNLHWRDYVRLRIADRAGNLSRKPFTFSEIRDYVDIFTIEEEVPINVNHLALKGGDLIKIFNLTPGPIVGILQRELLDFVIDNGEEFNDPENIKALSEVILTKIEKEL